MIDIILGWFGFLGLSGSSEEIPKVTLEPTVEVAEMVIERVDTNTEVMPETVAIPDIPGEISALSLKSFFHQKFEGGNFTIGNVLTDWGTHKSYYATYNSNGLKISGTWHVPKGEGPFPLIILNHGYFPPSEYTNGYGFGREQKYFAQQGYAVLHTDYRGYAYSDKDPLAYTGRRLGYTGYSADAINAILAIKAANLDYVDAERVVMFGHSMGGGVTLNAALARPDLIDVAVLWGPVSSDTYDNFSKWSLDRISDEGREVFAQEFGALDDPKSFKALSARTYLDRLQTPLLIQQGTADDSCPVAWARATDRALADLNKDYQYIEYEGYPHVFWNERWNQAIKDASTFMDENLAL